MSEKNVVKVVINGKVVRLGGFESKEYLERVAFYMNNKMEEMKELPGFSLQSAEKKSILLSLNIADDYFKAKQRADALEEDMEEKDSAGYSVKQELVAAQVKIRELEEKPEEMQKKPDGSGTEVR